MAPVAVPVAASSAVRGLLDGPERAGRVLAVFGSAMYVQVYADLPGERHPSLVALVTADAVRLPCAVVLAAHAADRPFAGLTPESAAALGAGSLHVGRLVVRPVRWWAPPLARPPLDRTALRPAVTALEGALRARRERLPAPLVAPAEALERSVADLDADAAASAARRLVGLGPGLTPAGDDVLAGLLVTLHHCGDGAVRPLVDRLGAEVDGYASERTTSLSAALLRHAARGEAAAELVGVVDALGGHRPLEPALSRLLRIGHSSGHDLARGVLAAGRALVDRPPATLASARPVGKELG